MWEDTKPTLITDCLCVVLYALGVVKATQSSLRVSATEYQLVYGCSDNIR